MEQSQFKNFFDKTDVGYCIRKKNFEDSFYYRYVLNYHGKGAEYFIGLHDKSDIDDALTMAYEDIGVKTTTIFTLYNLI